ncbi:MAG: hypothetical protein EON54_06430 [Alcaligenaceae bacterium]|nr:MAG: hypothetical protein EON54_06430 [Alcaligenaceae bacterium]
MAVGLKDAVSLRRFVRRSLSWCRLGALLMVASLCLSRFSALQTDGLMPLAAAVLTVFAATTSLLYNRARAYPPGPLQRRTLHAAEQSLRATLLLVVGIALSAAVFFWLPAASATSTFKTSTTGLAATMLSAPSILLFGFAAWLYVGALETLLPPMITSLETRLRFRRELERRKR